MSWVRARRVDGHYAVFPSHRTIGLCFLVMMVASCAGRSSGRSAAVAPAQAELLGTFVDDYQGTYSISPTLWQHGARLSYDIVAWHTDSQFLIARNAATNPREQGLWTRIDWMRLEGMAPYDWAYCLSAYKAPTRDSALATRVARRDTPRTGCNGFPFSRMRRSDP